MRQSATIIAAAAALIAATPLAADARAQEQTPVVRTVYYEIDTAQPFPAGEYTELVEKAVATWNDAVTTIEIKPGHNNGKRILIQADGSWPRAYATAFGAGVLFIGKQALDLGYDPLRIVSHEFGHFFGLGDVKQSDCDQLMTGRNGGIACTKAAPNAAEVAQAEANAATLPEAAAAQFAGRSADGTVRPMVVGGRPATETYPFMVSLKNSTGAHHCGGSLIAATWILTAKHCLDPASQNTFDVRIGSTDSATGGETNKVRRAARHWEADLALLELEKPAAARPIAVASSSAAVGTQARALGWGQTCPTAGCDEFPSTLQEIDSQIVENDRCGWTGHAGQGRICFGSVGGTAGPCFRDSGGPAVTRIDGEWTLIGTTSRGAEPCGTQGTTYVDDPAYTAWISQITTWKPPV